MSSSKSKLITISIMVCFATVLSVQSLGMGVQWTADDETSSWHNAYNWSYRPSVPHYKVPDAGDDCVIFIGYDNITPTVTGPAACAEIRINEDILIDMDTSDSVFDVGDDMLFGTEDPSERAAHLVLSSGIVDVAGLIHISVDCGGSTYTMGSGCKTITGSYIAVGGYKSGTLTQNGGHIACGGDTGSAPMYIGFDPNVPTLNGADFDPSDYIISGTYGSDFDDCTLVTKALLLAPSITPGDGYANLEIGSSAEAYIHVMGVDTNAADEYTASVSFGPNSTFTAGTSSSVEITMWDSAAEFDIQEGPDGSDLSGLDALTLVCSFVDSTTPETNISKVEAAGAFEDIGSVVAGDFSTANFVIDKLVIGNADAVNSNTVTLLVTDDYDNQDDGTTAPECLFVNTVEITTGGRFDTSGAPLYYLNGSSPKQLFAGDANLDGDVDAADLTTLAGNFNTSGTWDDGDFTGDGKVSLADLAMLATNYGSPGTATCEFMLEDDNTTLEIPADEVAADVTGLTDLTLVATFEDDGTVAAVVAHAVAIEAAGVFEDIGSVQTSDFNADNFVFGKLVIGNSSARDGAGKVTLTVTDDYDNQDDGTTNSECLYVNTLEMAEGGTYDSTGAHIYYLNGILPKQLFMGDANLDGAVSLADLTILATNYDSFGDEGTSLWEHGDFNGDREVTLSDLTNLATYYGSGTSTKGSGVTVTCTTTSVPTVDLAGYWTVDVKISVDTGVIDGFALEFTGDDINQVNPFGAATVFENNNFAFPFVTPAIDVEQDSQFLFNTGNLGQIMVQTESGTSLKGHFLLDSGDRASQVWVAQIVLPTNDEVTLTGVITVVDETTGALIGGGEIAVSTTIAK